MEYKRSAKLGEFILKIRIMGLPLIKLDSIDAGMGAIDAGMGAIDGGVHGVPLKATDPVISPGAKKGIIYTSFYTFQLLPKRSLEIVCTVSRRMRFHHERISLTNDLSIPTSRAGHRC